MNDIKSLLDCSTPQKEYWSHVADQHELPIAPGRQLPTKLEYISQLIDQANFEDAAAFQELIAYSLVSTPNLLDELRLFAGFSDKRLYLSLSYEFSRSIYQSPSGEMETLCGCEPSSMNRHSTQFFKSMLTKRGGQRRFQAAQLIARLLLQNGLADTLHAYSKLDPIDQHKLLLRLVFVKEAQQNEAKRRGHGAEALVASVLQFAGCTILPPDKADNPIGARDPNIDLKTLQVAERNVNTTMSCDIAVVDANQELRAWVVGLVQSSDPGQFGVDKGQTTGRIRHILDATNQQRPKRVELWGIVDGVGYSENKSGTIDPMLESFHQFIQTKSAYKAALAAHRLGVGNIAAVYFDSTFYSETTKKQMIERYVPTDVDVLQSVDEASASLVPMDAGRATIFKA